MNAAEPMQGVFGLLPTTYTEELEIDTDDLRAGAEFCCRTGQHGIVWPVMVGEFYFLGESERVRSLEAVLDQVNGRVPVVFGCSGVSVSQSVYFARSAQRAGATSIVAMAPQRTNQQVAQDMYRRLGDAFAGPIMIQNATGYAPLTGEQIAQLAEEVPHIDYVKEERQPGPPHIAEVVQTAGDRIKTVFGGAGGKVFPAELRRGAMGTMPACQMADLLVKVFDLWQQGDEEGARAVHTRILPLINLENHYFFRYILRRRGVIKSMIERAPGAGGMPFDAEECHEITILWRAVEDLIDSYSLGPQ